MTAPQGRRVVVEADGGSRGNPGPAGYGAVVKDADTGEVLAERSASLGIATNNVAEYNGLIAGLDAARELDPADVQVRMDSKLVVEQMSGRWQIKHPDMKPLALKAQRIARELPSVSYTWIPRERNKHADRLANEAMDGAAVGKDWAPPVAIQRVGADQDSSAADVAQRTAAAEATLQASTVATTTLLLRHGQTVHSVDRRFSGRNELPLTELGILQAQGAAKRLAGVPGIGGVVSSPLLRAKQTAAEVARVLGVEPAIDEDLIETDFGDFEGLSFAEARERFPAELTAWMGSMDVAPPNGESFATVAKRVRRARTRLISLYGGQSVVVVTHVTPIKLMIRAGLDAGPSVLYRLHLDLASLSTVEWYADGRASVRLVNDTSHLPG